MSVTLSATCSLSTTFSLPKQSAGNLRRCSVNPGVESWEVPLHHTMERFFMTSLPGTGLKDAPPSVE